MSKKRSIYYALYLFLLTAICLILAMEGVEAATYNFYFNNTEQGANSNASPTLTVKDGKKHIPPMALPVEEGTITTTEQDRPLIPNPLPPAPWGVEKPKAATPRANLATPEVEVDQEEEDTFEAPAGEANPTAPNEYPAFEPAAEKPSRTTPLVPGKVALSMTVPQILAALFSAEIK